MSADEDDDDDDDDDDDRDGLHDDDDDDDDHDHDHDVHDDDNDDEHDHDHDDDDHDDDGHDDDDNDDHDEDEDDDDDDDDDHDHDHDDDDDLGKPSTDTLGVILGEEPLEAYSASSRGRLGARWCLLEPLQASPGRVGGLCQPRVPHLVGGALSPDIFFFSCANVAHEALKGIIRSELAPFQMPAIRARLLCRPSPGEGVGRSALMLHQRRRRGMNRWRGLPASWTARGKQINHAAPQTL